MIKRKEIIQDIKNGDTALQELSLEATRRCGLKCAHCYVGDAQNVTIQPEVTDAIFSQFRNIDLIYLLGGENQKDINGLQNINNSIRKHGVRFHWLSFVTSMADFNPDFFEVVNESYHLATEHYDDVVSIGVSNDEWHTKAIKEAGYADDVVKENVAKLKSKYPHFTVNCRKYDDRYTDYLMKLGRAKELEGQEGVQFKEHDQGDEKGLWLRKRRGYTEMDFVHINARGFINTAYCMEYVTGDKENRGNILEKPFSEFLINECNEKPGDSKWGNFRYLEKGEEKLYY